MDGSQNATFECRRFPMSLSVKLTDDRVVDDARIEAEIQN